MATINLGKIAFKWRGNYAAETVYARQDVVANNGDSFVCLVDGTVGVTPVVGANWQLFAQGTAGVSSAAGEVIYNNGSGLVALPAGTAGQVLQISPATNLPVWGPADVRSSTRVKALPISASTNGQPFTYRAQAVIMNDDSIRAWGDNTNYKLGDGTTFARSYPVRPAFPPGFPGAKEVHLAYNTNGMCIDLDGKFWIWGDNSYGQCGTGNTTVQRVPYCASDNALNSINGKQVTAIAHLCGTESYMSVALLCSDGTVHTCGYNAHGQLGQGDTTNRSNFNMVPALTNVVQIAGGRERYSAYYAVTGAGQLYSWGYNADGQLGTGNTTQANLPVLRNTGSIAGKTIVKVFGQYQASFVLDSLGALHATGVNTTYGNLGNGNFVNQTSYVQVATSVADVYSGSHDYPVTFIKKTDKTLWACGAGAYQANGSTTATNSANFVQIPIGNTVVKAIHSGTGSYNWGAALLEDGTVRTWGYNGNGVIMSGDLTSPWPVATPQTVPTGNRTVVDIMCWNQSSEQSIGMLMDDGQLFVGGYAGGSSLPEDDSEASYVPMPVVF
jgi:alpha-tubulin suppressor-like RCC1 family protein